MSPRRRRTSPRRKRRMNGPPVDRMDCYEVRLELYRAENKGKPKTTEEVVRREELRLKKHKCGNEIR